MPIAAVRLLEVRLIGVLRLAERFVVSPARKFAMRK